MSRIFFSLMFERNKWSAQKVNYYSLLYDVVIKKLWIIENHLPFP